MLMLAWWIGSTANEKRPYRIAQKGRFYVIFNSGL